LQRILHQAHFDTLTDLPNRFLSLDRLGHAIREARRSGECVSVLFLDLDDFKKINDSLGHEVGDRVLVEAAARLRGAVRSGDTVGRLGGDEFVVLLGLPATRWTGTMYPNCCARRIRPCITPRGRVAMPSPSSPKK